MNKHPGLVRAVLVGAFSALALACGGGCVGTRARKPAELPEGVVVTKDYEQVYLTGSHIPVLVPKSPTARASTPMAPVVIMSAEDAKRVIAPPAP